MGRAGFHPELKLWRFLPRGVAGPRVVPVIRFFDRVVGSRPPEGGEVVQIGDGVTARVFAPPSGRSPSPAILWIHGGGMVIGKAAMDDTTCRSLAGELDVLVVSVDYRLAPEHPFPTPLEDCHAALTWIASRPDVDSSRIAVAGVSAGGGLAAGLSLMVRERGPVVPAVQVLSYPMIDDRSAYRTDVDNTRFRLWNQPSNRFGWRSYLGTDGADADVSPWAAPARADDLAGLPPTWIGVGTNDLFHDENVEFARRLEAAGVPCSLMVVPGAYHAFDAMEPKAAVSQAFHAARLSALAQALNGPGAAG